MSKITGKLSATAAVVLLLSAVSVSADQQRDTREAAPPPPREAHVAPPAQVQRPAPEHAGQAPRFTPPAAPQQPQVQPRAGRPMPERAERVAPPAAAPAQPPQSQSPPRFQQRNPPQGGAVSDQGGARPNQAGSRFNPGDANPGGPAAGPRFNPGNGSQAGGNPGGARFNPGGADRGDARYQGGGHFNQGNNHYNPGPRFNSGGHAGPGGRPGYGGPYRGALPGQYQYARQPHHGAWRGPPPGLRPARPWNGGSWRGGYWPPVYYTGSYPLFLAVLPGVYLTYWWGSVPYYYANDVYYTWSPQASGYVVTDPPPMLSDEDLGAIEAEGDGDADAAAAQDPDLNTPDDVYAYPRAGQSPEQQASDKYACHTWAVQQSGYDPTNPGAGSGDSDAYRRAMIACLEGRGYSTG